MAQRKLSVWLRASLTALITMFTLLAAPAVEAGGTPLEVQTVVAGSYHACTIFTGGYLKCWGYNNSGQLGLGDSQSRGAGPDEMGDNLPFVDLGTGRTAKSVALGLGHTCAILDDDSLKCWGDAGNGRLGNGDASNSRGDQPEEMGDNLPTVDLGSGRKAVAVAAGRAHTCALLDNGDVKCWGANTSGQLGLGDTDDRGDAPDEMGDNLEPVDLGTGVTVKAIVSHPSASHTCVLLEGGSIKCWGFNSNGQLGYGQSNHQGDGPNEMGDDLPSVDLGTGKTAQAVAVGYVHTCAVLTSGEVKCWGYNIFGQLGYGDTKWRGDKTGDMGDALPTVDLGTGKIATALSLGYAHSCAVLNDDWLKCWGNNGFGQLGYEDTVQRGDGPDEMGDDLTAVDLGAGRTVTAVTSGEFHNCAMLDNGDVKCWALGNYGQLGSGDTNNLGDEEDEMGDALDVLQVGYEPAEPPTAAPTAAPTVLPTSNHAKHRNDDDDDDSVAVGFALALACCSFVLALFLLWKQRKQEDGEQNKPSKAQRAIELASQQP